MDKKMNLYQFYLYDGEKHVSGCPHLYVYAESYKAAVEIVDKQNELHMQDRVFNTEHWATISDHPWLVVGW